MVLTNDAIETVKPKYKHYQRSNAECPRFLRPAQLGYSVAAADPEARVISSTWNPSGA